MVSRCFWSRALFGLATLLGATPALAQTTTTATGSELTASDFIEMKVQRPDGDDWVDLAKVDQDLYFNQARCQCEEEGKIRIVVQVASASRSKVAALATTSSYVRLYVGIGCAALNANSVPACAGSQLGSDTKLSTLSSTGSWAVETSVKKLFGSNNCAHQGATTVYLWIDSKGLGYPDSSVQGSSAPALSINLDGAPPPAPSGVVVEGGNEALEVSWAPTDVTNTEETAGFVVFCMRGDGLVVFEPSLYDEQFWTGPSLCGKGTLLGASTSISSLAGKTTADEVPPPLVFQTLNVDYMCTERLSASDTSTRLRVLQNGIPYTVGVAAVDKSGNISPITSAFVQKPVATVDFYRAYRNAGGEAEGGYCSLGGWTGRPGAMTCLAGLGLLALCFRRRRRDPSGTRGLTVLLVLLGAGSAQAQPAVTHEDVAQEDIEATFEEPSRGYATSKNLAFELRFGAYRPDIDSEFSGTGVTPYKDVYGGGRHLMSQFELDWQFFQAFGSLSLAGVVGYYSQTAKAYIADSDTGASTGERSGDDTNLRLIPTAALLVYRFDVMALHWGIPLVPYAKAGLNYTFWRITDGNGNIPHYLDGRGSGGTLGWQAAAGISLMLDFIDPMAARSLDMETGVNHTHLFFEWNKVEANGLGQSKKLHVGDSSWVVGLMFEF